MMDRSKLYRRFRTLLIANRGEIAARDPHRQDDGPAHGGGLFRTDPTRCMSRWPVTVLLGPARAATLSQHRTRDRSGAKTGAPRRCIPAMVFSENLNSRRRVWMQGSCSSVRPLR
jgi:hypothetical protein